MNTLQYANEKFHSAVLMLVENGTAQERLRNAFTAFHPVQASDFDDAKMCTKYEEIMQRLTVVRDPDKGYVSATLEVMSDEEARSINRLIVGLAIEIAEARAQGNG